MIVSLIGSYLWNLECFFAPDTFLITALTRLFISIVVKGFSTLMSLSLPSFNDFKLGFDSFDCLYDPEWSDSRPISMSIMTFRRTFVVFDCINCYQKVGNDFTKVLFTQFRSIFLSCFKTFTSSFGFGKLSFILTQLWVCSWN